MWAFMGSIFEDFFFFSPNNFLSIFQNIQKLPTNGERHIQPTTITYFKN